MNVEQFSEFVSANISKILDIPHPRYPLNRDKVGDWINKHPDNWKDLARLVSNLFQNVSWDEFLDRMNKVANELGAYSNRDLYLFIPFKDEEKSNFFATVLFFYIFCHVQGHSFKGLCTFEQQQPPPGSLIVIVDDASYSGTQLYEFMRYTRRPDVPIFFAVPYISVTARVLLKSTYYDVIIPEISEPFHTLQTYLEDSKIDIDVTKMCKVIKNRHGLYFDFKLPDTLSDLSPILAYGFTIDQILDTVECGGGNYWKTDDDNSCLIDGCEEDYKENWPGVQEVGDTDDIYTCPHSFYHDIQWTWKGQPISLSTLSVEPNPP